MSCESELSSGSSFVRRGSCDGIPKKCSLCGRKVELLISRSKANPNRKFFRCEYAAANKLVGDNHLFKWLSDAVPEEVLKTSPLLEILAKDVAKSEARSLEVQKMVVEKMEEQTKKVNMVVEKMEEQTKKVWTACGVTFIGCLVVVVISKLF